MKRVMLFASAVSMAACSSENSNPNVQPNDNTPVMAGVAAKVFWPAPAPTGVDVADLVDVQLGDLIEAKVGGNLRGWHMQTTNCCKRYTCAGGEDACDVGDRVCAADDDADAISSVIAAGIPTAMVPFDLSQLGFTGDTIYMETVFCTEKPRLTSQAEGWFAVPVDSTRSENEGDGLASETDAFAEVQIYHATQTYFEHIREVLEDPSFCLGPKAMQCEADGSAVVEDGKPVLPFHITANMLFPEFNMTSIGAQLAPPPLGLGRGQSEDDPVKIDDFGRMGNAMFMPALDGPPIDLPPELAPLLEQFNRPYDSNIYLQGERDFGYDGDVVFHEFTHGVVHTLKPGLHSMGRDHWGSHAEPGSMNEGWSDYFAASFMNDSVTGEYAGAGLRNADNSDTCPDSVIGEVHQDSLPWSGALWDIREAVEAGLGQEGVDTLDQLLLAAIAEADDDEDMARQSARIVQLVREDPDLGPFETDAAAAFATHGVAACERVHDLAVVDGTNVNLSSVQVLFQPSPGEIGVTNMAPSVVQLRVQVPAGSPGFTVSWDQASAGIIPGMGGGTGDVLSVLAHEGEPIDWHYEGGALAIPYDQAGDTILFDPEANQAVVDADAGSADFTVELTPACETRTFYLSVIATAGGTTLENIRATVQPDDGGC